MPLQSPYLAESSFSSATQLSTRAKYSSVVSKPCAQTRLPARRSSRCRSSRSRISVHSARSTSITIPRVCDGCMLPPRPNYNGALSLNPSRKPDFRCGALPRRADKPKTAAMLSGKAVHHGQTKAGAIPRRLASQDDADRFLVHILVQQRSIDRPAVGVIAQRRRCSAAVGFRHTRHGHGDRHARHFHYYWTLSVYATAPVRRASKPISRSSRSAHAWPVGTCVARLWAWRRGTYNYAAFVR
jgi:hypothetical protein